MYNSIHSKFIKTPIFDILKDGVNACCGVGCGMETYPLRDYVMQSLFLKMTGAQEQKLKCICWEMATNDYDYRRTYLDKVKSDYGEFSNYDQKNKVYNQLINEIKKHNNKFKIENLQWLKDIDANIKNELFNQEVSIKAEIEIKKQSKKNTLNEEIQNRIRTNIEGMWNKKKDEIIIEPIKKKFVTDIKDNMISLIESSVLSIGDWCNYSFWKKDVNIISATKCALKGNLLKENLKTMYENDVIRHRHKCAHNLTSYQQNLPTLSTLAESGYNYHSYFFRFAILILIDEIFIRLYTEYVDQIDSNPFNI